MTDTPPETGLNGLALLGWLVLIAGLVAINIWSGMLLKRKRCPVGAWPKKFQGNRASLSDINTRKTAGVVNSSGNR